MVGEQGGGVPEGYEKDIDIARGKAKLEKPWRDLASRSIEKGKAVAEEFGRVSEENNKILADLEEKIMYLTDSKSQSVTVYDSSEEGSYNEEVASKLSEDFEATDVRKGQPSAKIDEDGKKEGSFMAKTNKNGVLRWLEYDKFGKLRKEYYAYTGWAGAKKEMS